MSIEIGKDIHLIEETNHAILFSHRWAKYLVAFAVGALLTLIGSLEIVVERKSLIGTVVAVLGFILALAIGRSAFWREELRIDLDSREFQWKRGYLFGAETQARSMDCLKGVELASGFSVGGEGVSYAADINLLFEAEEAITLADAKTPTEAYDLLEHYATVLRIPALLWEDEREERQVSVPWDKLADFLVQRKAKPE